MDIQLFIFHEVVAAICQMCYHDNLVNQCDYVSELIHHEACHLKGYFHHSKKNIEFDAMGPETYHNCWKFMNF